MEHQVVVQVGAQGLPNVESVNVGVLHHPHSGLPAGLAPDLPALVDAAQHHQVTQQVTVQHEHEHVPIDSIVGMDSSTFLLQPPLFNVDLSINLQSFVHLHALNSCYVLL